MRDHKLHHRYTETNADPHNSKRGFFFAHIGWLMLAKHPEFVEKEKEHKLSELMNDPFVRFNEKWGTLEKLTKRRDWQVFFIRLQVLCTNEIFVVLFTAHNSSGVWLEWKLVVVDIGDCVYTLHCHTEYYLGGK
jgi:fatty-acid desaturase